MVLLLLLVKILLDFMFFINIFCKELFSLGELILGRFFKFSISGFDLNLGLEVNVNVGDICILLLVVRKIFVLLL